MQQSENNENALPPSPLTQRLARRATEPLGVIDTRRPQRLYSRTAGWIAQRFALLDDLKFRHGASDEAGPQSTSLVFAKSPEHQFLETFGGFPNATDFPLTAEKSETVMPSRESSASAAASSPATVLAKSSSPSSQTRISSGEKFRVSRRPAFLHAAQTAANKTASSPHQEEQPPVARNAAAPELPPASAAPTSAPLILPKRVGERLSDESHLAPASATAPSGSENEIPRATPNAAASPLPRAHVLQRASEATGEIARSSASIPSVMPHSPGENRSAVFRTADMMSALPPVNAGILPPRKATLPSPLILPKRAPAPDAEASPSLAKPAGKALSPQASAVASASIVASDSAPLSPPKTRAPLPLILPKRVNEPHVEAPALLTKQTEKAASPPMRAVDSTSTLAPTDPASAPEMIAGSHEIISSPEIRATAPLILPKRTNAPDSEAPANLTGDSGNTISSTGNEASIPPPVAAEIPAARSFASNPSMVWRKATDSPAGDFAWTGINDDGRTASPSTRNLVNDRAVMIARQPETTGGQSSSSTNMEAAMPQPASAPGNKIDLTNLTEQISRRLLRQLAVERERRGIGRWQ